MYNIDNKNCNITKRWTSRSKICERLVAWSINDEESRKSEINWNIILYFITMTLDILWWEESRTDLLCNTTSFSSLNICPSKFIKNQSFTSIDVTHNTHDWASKFSSCVLILIVLPGSNFGHVFCSSGSSCGFSIVIVVSSSKNINSCDFGISLSSFWFNLFFGTFISFINFLFCLFYCFGKIIVLFFII